jgi:hypothetical protein
MRQGARTFNLISIMVQGRPMVLGFAVSESQCASPNTDNQAEQPAASRRFRLDVNDAYWTVILLTTFFTPLTSLTRLVARSFSASFLAFPLRVTTPSLVVTLVLIPLVER